MSSMRPDAIEITLLALMGCLFLCFGVWSLHKLLDDEIGMSQCMAHHSYDTCHNAIYR
jgi:hypothetical protein